MACPFFYPLARFESNSWAVPPRLPLGDPYTGECRATGAAFQPEEHCVREICNVGYGRGRCDRFPETAPADAVRFHVAEDGGEALRVQYVLERDCWPAQHGALECSAESVAGTDDEILRKQAAAFLASYLRRRSES